MAALVTADERRRRAERGAPDLARERAERVRAGLPAEAFPVVLHCECIRARLGLALRGGFALYYKPWWAECSSCNARTWGGRERPHLERDPVMLRVEGGKRWVVRVPVLTDRSPGAWPRSLMQAALGGDRVLIPKARQLGLSAAWERRAWAYLSQVMSSPMSPPPTFMSTPAAEPSAIYEAVERSQRRLRERAQQELVERIQRGARKR